MLLKFTILALVIACASAMPGGFVEQKEVSEEVLGLANWAANAMSANVMHSVVAVKNVRAQVVAGMNYKFTVELSLGNGIGHKSCEMNIFYQSWTNTRKLNEAPKCTGDRIMSRSLAGGIEEHSEVSESAKDVAMWAAGQLALGTNQVHQVLSIKNVRTQIVSGIIYMFELEMLVDGTITKTCQMSILDQPWLGVRSYTKNPVCFELENGRAPISGGFEQQKEVSEDAIGVAEWAADMMTTSLGVTHSVIEVTNLRTQVVHGMNYKFVLEMSVDGFSAHKLCEMSVFQAFDRKFPPTRRFNEEPKCLQPRL